MCGLEFNEKEGKNACASCVMKGCGMIKCPNCGYELPLEAKSLTSFKRGIVKLKQLIKKEKFELKDNAVIPITKLKKGITAKIAYINTENKNRLQKLMSLGILPGKPIELIQKFPSYVLQIRHTQAVVDKEIAQDIFVRFKKD
jgi:Fe2+ transport system protein FeoA